MTMNRTQEDITRDWRAAKARAQDTLAAVRAESAEARAAAQVALDLREMRDVVRVHEREAEETIGTDQAETQRRARRAAFVQRQRADTSAEAVCNLIVEITSPIIEGLQRQLSEAGKRAHLNEQRCTALEKRCASAEARIAKVETRALSAPIDGLASFTPHSKAH